MLVCSSVRRPASLRVLLRVASKALEVVRLTGLRGVVRVSILGLGVFRWVLVLLFGCDWEQNWLWGW